MGDAVVFRTGLPIIKGLGAARMLADDVLLARRGDTRFVGGARDPGSDASAAFAEGFLLYITARMQVDHSEVSVVRGSRRGYKPLLLTVAINVVALSVCTYVLVPMR